MVARRLTLFVTMLALLLAPLSMIGGHAMAAQYPTAGLVQHHQQMPPSHCVEIGGETGDSDAPGSPQHKSPTDCALACSAICAPDGPLPAWAPVIGMAQSLPLAEPLGGLVPEAVDPPPRTA